MAQSSQRVVPEVELPSHESELCRGRAFQPWQAGREILRSCPSVESPSTGSWEEYHRLSPLKFS